MAWETEILGETPTPVSLSTTNPTQTALRLNLGPHNEKLASYSMNCHTASLKVYQKEITCTVHLLNFPITQQFTKTALFYSLFRHNPSCTFWRVLWEWREVVVEDRTVVFFKFKMHSTETK
jgi:hypothetical protein